MMIANGYALLDFFRYGCRYGSVAGVEHADDGGVGEAGEELGFLFGNVALLSAVDGCYFEHEMVDLW